MGHKFPFSRKDVLDSDKRRKLLPAIETLTALGLGPGDRLLDVGCGTGYFSLPASEIVGPEGEVIGVDVHSEFVDHARRRIPEGRTNLRFELSEENHFPCDTSSVDAALIANVLHEAESPVEFLTEIKRALTDQGRLLIIEWLPIETQMGPPLAERIAPEALQLQLRSNGFDPGEPISLGAAHYGIIAKK